MNTRTRASLLLSLLVFLFGVCLSSCGSGSSGDPKKVPPSFERARVMPGHVAHLGKATAVDGAPRMIVCDDCHDVEKQGFESPGTKPCARCHASEDARHHKGSDALPTTCLVCHAFSRAEGAPATVPTCAGCHAKLATLGATLVGKKPHASHVEEGAKCTTCHAPHAEQPKTPVDCRSCHETIEAKHGQGSVCTTCHTPHAAAKEAATACAGCHVVPTSTLAGATALTAPKVKPSGAKVASHEACTTCHTPHLATKKDVAACTKCHADHQNTTTSSGKGHTECIGCHAPHSPASVRSSCTSCHLGHAAMGAPEIEAHAECTSCHDPHTPKKSPLTACGSCHANIHPKHAATPACTGCHDMHPKSTTAFAIARPCSSCHKALASTDTGVHAKGKVECNQCHQQHDFTLAKPTASFCVRCHSKIQKQVLQPGHAECTGCHAQPHAPAPKPCGSCHTKEQASAPKGHDACASCHAPHGGNLIVGAIARPTALAVTAAFCTSCHTNKKKVLHTEIAGGCANCHRPHGPDGVASLPACTSCHAAASLPGLHQKPSHAAKCENCHGGHTGPSATRDTCTGSCHAERKTHQPDALTCQGCHVFRK